MTTTRKIAAAALTASIAFAGTASAAQAPTLGPMTVIKAGQESPVAIGGNDLHQGATIRKGTEMRRWRVTMHGPSDATVTLKCGPGAKVVGLGQHEGTAAHVRVESPYRRRTIKVSFAARPGTDADGATGSVFALCKAS